MDFKDIRKSALLKKTMKEAGIHKVFTIVTQAFNKLELINTDGIKPADFPYTLKRSYLREDEIVNEVNDDFKKNVKTNKENFVVIKGAGNE